MIPGSSLSKSLILAAALIMTRPCAAGEYSGTASENVQLSSGETLSKIWAVSYNKLRRGTEIEFSYELMIGRDACFLLTDDAANGTRGVKMEVTSSAGLQTTIVKKFRSYKVDAINTKVRDCYSAVGFKTRVTAPSAQPLGTQKVNGVFTWQAASKNGVLAPHTTEFEITIEVVERDDHTAKYNESYGYRPKADLLWRIPAFPFVLIYCGATGGGDCPN